MKTHAFFNSINWSDLDKKRITPPFKPQVVSDTDTRYFDSEFTGNYNYIHDIVLTLYSGESVELTPPDNFNSHLISSIPEDEDEPGYFDQFSYQNPSSVIGGHSLLTGNSFRSYAVKN